MLKDRTTRVALLGGAAWVLLLILARTGLLAVTLAEQIFLLAPLVILPLGLRLVDAGTPVHPDERLHLAVMGIQPFCAFCACASFFLPKGVWAGLLAGVWFIYTGLVALLGVNHLLAGGRRRLADVCVDAGLIFLSVGGVWFLLTRFGKTPAGFSETIVLLTAVHFHFAGFAAPILVGLAGRRLTAASHAMRRLYRIVAIGVMVGVPFVAVGISVGGLLELLAAFFLATTLGLVAYPLVVLVRTVLTHRVVRGLVVVSAVSVVVGMVFAYVYAYSVFTGHALIGIPGMVASHGLINAFGFALCGLLGWHLFYLKEQVSS